MEERNSLDALKVFITHACEVLGLWKILCENQLNNIVNCLTKVIFYLSRVFRVKYSSFIFMYNNSVLVSIVF